MARCSKSSPTPVEVRAYVNQYEWSDGPLLRQAMRLALSIDGINEALIQRRLSVDRACAEQLIEEMRAWGFIVPTIASGAVFPFSGPGPFKARLTRSRFYAQLQAITGE